MTNGAIASDTPTALTPEAVEALRKQLAQIKGREDIEILGVIGVSPELVQEWFGSAPGLVFEVEFTFTSGRRYRRKGPVPFRTGGETVRDYGSVRIPPALLQFLSEAVRLAGEPNDAEVR